MPLRPILRGEGSFADFLQRRSGDVFGDGYHNKDGRDASTSSWRTRPLPLAAKVLLVSAFSVREFAECESPTS